jgi:hypothetical protein
VPGEEDFMITEVVAADPKTAPDAIPDGSNNFAYDPSILDPTVGVGVLNIRSVYDYDGAPIFNIEAMADPELTPAIDRPARFLRIEKAVSLPDEDATGIELDNTDFGISTQQGMKEIVGYAMIEPDGSVVTKVPANVALAISVVDRYGKRITARHQNWIQVRPGQELTCNGCHVANAEPPTSHGRFDAFESAYAGAPPGTLLFPNTDAQWAIDAPGETMAEVRARVTCNDTVNPCSSIEPSMNAIYRDVWSADPDTRLENENIDYLYQDLDIALASPTSTECEQEWTPLCRSVINYIENIHPLWSLSRPAEDADGNPILDPVTGLQVDNQCIACHAFPYIDPNDGVTILPPAGQLELTDGLSADEPDHYHAYRELLVTDNLQEVVNDALVDVLEDTGQVDIDGNPILTTVPTPPPARINGARGFSDAFFVRFETEGNSHYNLLSGAERRLIAEWLDIGAQYYNNPFDVPQ